MKRRGIVEESEIEQRQLWDNLFVYGFGLMMVTYMFTQPDPLNHPLGQVLMLIACGMIIVGALLGCYSFYKSEGQRTKELISAAYLSKEKRRITLAPSVQTCNLPPMIKELLNLILSNQERDYIIGDLLEEFEQLQPREAKAWLYKQLLTSVLPIIHKNMMNRLVTYLRKRTH